MRIPERIARLNEKILELENRIEELERKLNVGKVDQIGFSIDIEESVEHERSWDNTGEVWPTHWTEDKHG